LRLKPLAKVFSVGCLAIDSYTINLLLELLHNSRKTKASPFQLKEINAISGSCPLLYSWSKQVAVLAWLELDCGGRWVLASGRWAEEGVALGRVPNFVA